MRREDRLLAVGVVLFILGIAILASSAKASTPMQTASDAWPSSLCHDQPITILWDHAQAIQFGFEGNATGVTQLDGGAWRTDRCEITLDPNAVAGMTQSERCELMVHEAGHLAGIRHTASGIMSPHGGWYGPCHTQRERIKHDIALRVSDPDPFVACGRWKRDVMRCHADWTEGAESWARTAWFRVRRAGETYTIKRIRSPR